VKHLFFTLALRVGKESMGMQGITELFHTWATKSFYWMHGRRQKVFEKIRGIRQLVLAEYGLH